MVWRLPRARPEPRLVPKAGAAGATGAVSATCAGAAVAGAWGAGAAGAASMGSLPAGLDWGAWFSSVEDMTLSLQGALRRGGGADGLGDRGAKNRAARADAGKEGILGICQMVNSISEDGKTA